MVVEVTTRALGSGEAVTWSNVERLTLEDPAQITLGPETPPLTRLGKVGTDLSLQFETGEHLYIEGFFEVGDTGDVSRLSTASGQPLASGLLAPEPDLSEDQRMIEIFPEIGESSDASSSLAPASDPFETAHHLLSDALTTGADLLTDYPMEFIV